VSQFALPPKAHPGSIVAAVLIGVWAVAVTALVQVVTWVIEQAVIIQGLPWPAWAPVLTGWLNALLVGVPAVLLALIPRAPVIRVTGRVWTTGALVLGVCATARAVPVEQNEVYLLLLTTLATVLALAARRPRTVPGPPAEHGPDGIEPGPPTGSRPDGTGREALPYGVAAGLAALLPWLCLGALGGAVETGLAVTAAAALGWLAAALLDRDFWTRFTGSGWRRVGLGGLVAGVTLALLGAGTGAGGLRLAEMLVLSPLGFAAAALARRAPGRRASPALAVLIGLAALGPLAFVEPVQTSLVLGVRDVGYWALIAAAGSLLVGLLFGLGYGLGLRRPPARPVGVVTVLVMVAAGLVGYLTVGHPGSYGDRLFVVMKAQAGLAGLDAIGDVKQRRTEAYHRLVDTAERTQAPLRGTLSQLHLGYTPFYLVNGLEVDGDAAVRAWLSRRSDVDRVLLSPRLRPLPSAATPMTGRATADGAPQWNIKMIKADQVWAAGDTGAGIVIGASDSGVDAGHPALAGGFRGGADSWYDPWHGSSTPADHGGHGTHTLGTALGRGGIGVAPGAQWIGCVNLDRNMANPPYYLRCLQFMLAPFRHGGDPLRDGRPDRGADVLTNSWGCPALEGCDARALRPAIDALTAAGIFVVAAAGNSGPSCATITDPPAPYPDTFTVGAVDRNGVVAPFSSRGPAGTVSKPDVTAPGTAILSALPGGGYGTLDGTSMAAPHVAGVVALMWAANPRLVGDVGRTAQILRQTASPATGTGGCGPGDDAGAGIVDAAAAVRAAQVG
jgi:hypothetical protein